MLPTVRLLTGLPASGKTSVARDLAKGHKGHLLRVNLDEIRAMIHHDPHGPHYTDTHEATASRMQDYMILTALGSGFDVVVDNTHLTPRGPERIRTLLRGRRITFVIHDLTHVSLEECVKRDSRRDKPVGEEVITKLFKAHLIARQNDWKLTASWMSGN